MLNVSSALISIGAFTLSYPEPSVRRWWQYQVLLARVLHLAAVGARPSSVGGCTCFDSVVGESPSTTQRAAGLLLVSDIVGQDVTEYILTILLFDPF